MIWYCLKRLIAAIVTLLGVTGICFFVLQLAPGDYFTQLESNPEISRETIAQLRTAYGIDQPLMKQYICWVYHLICFDFGVSLIYNIPIKTLILQRMTHTLILSFSTMVMTWLIAVPLGIYCAVYRDTIIDRVVSILSFLSMSLPPFFIAFLLVLFAASTGMLPVGGIQSPAYETYSMIGKISDRLYHLILPVSVLVIASVAGLIRLIRSHMIEILQAPFIIAARARGIKESRVLFCHALKNILNPFITMFGYQLAGLLSGVALTEAIVSYPGLGRLILEAVLQQDIYLVMAALFMSTILLLVGNMCADIVLHIVDPRIKR